MAQLNYKTLRQEVADEIRRKILKGEFKAGERIKEHEMAQMLGVSRGPVREALRQLQIPVPQQTQLLSWDDIPLSSATKPALSVIHISAEEMVAEACRELRGMIERGEENRTHMLFPPKLIIRDTTLPLPDSCKQQID